MLNDNDESRVAIIARELGDVSVNKRRIQRKKEEAVGAITIIQTKAAAYLLNYCQDTDTITINSVSSVYVRYSCRRVYIRLLYLLSSGCSARQPRRLYTAAEWPFLRVISSSIQCNSNLFVWLCASEITPFFHHSSKVNWVERNKDLSDLIVFRKSIKVVHGKRERLRANLCVRHLLENTHHICTRMTENIRHKHGCTCDTFRKYTSYLHLYPNCIWGMQNLHPYTTRNTPALVYDITIQYI